MKFECTSKEWERFVKVGLLYTSDDSNVKYDFNKMTKKFGIAYLSYLEAAYECKDSMTDEDFCKLNGNVPINFLEKL